MKTHQCTKCGKKYGTIKSLHSCCTSNNKDRTKQREWQKEYARRKRGYYDTPMKSKKVIDTATNEEFESITKAADSVGYSVQYVSSMLSGIFKNITNLIYKKQNYEH
jgi:predicted  nucleic acid-binding Zn-ribbon protein